MSDCCDVFRFTDPGDGFSVGEGGQGPAGKSAYQAAVEAGFTGTEEEFNEYLSVIGDLTDEVAQQKSAIEDLQDLTNRKAGILRDTVSGAIASFVPDSTIPDLLGVTVDIEPVQDLHGYDSPWPAGGGVNKLSPFSSDDYGGTVSADGLTVTTSTRTNNNLTRCVLRQSIDVVQDVTYYISFDARLVSGSCDNFASVSLVDSNGNSLFNWRTLVENPTLSSSKQRYKFYATAKATETAAKFYIQGNNTNNAVVEFSNVCISLTANYDYAPYSNLCPISGWDAVGIESGGVNLCDEVFELGAIVNGNNYSSQNNLRTKNHISVVGGESYYSTCPAEIILFQYDKDKTLIRQGNQPYIAVPSGTSFTATAGARYIRFYTQPAYGTTYNNDISINYPATDHNYHAYSGNTYTITIGQTVYGGTLDAVNGTMTVDKVLMTLNGTEAWAVTSGLFRLNMTGYLKGDIANGISSAYPVIAEVSSAAQVPGKTAAFLNDPSFSRFMVRDNGYATVDDFKAALAQTPMQVVYTVAEPITIQLDPVTIATIAGQTNNLWSDAGDVDVTYAADIKAYIDRLNQPTEDDMIANSLIAANKYFTVNNRLFLSTVSIAAGAQIIPGTNCTETSLAAALNALNA